MCLKFVDGSYSWDEARTNCENQGGYLLKEMCSKLKEFLEKSKKDSDLSWWLGDTTDLSWWLGSELKGDSGSSSCSHLELNPLKFSTSSNCQKKRGFLCIHRIPDASEVEHFGQPSPANRSDIVVKLTAAAVALSSPVDNSTVSRILNATTALFKLSLTRCDVESDPNPTVTTFRSNPHPTGEVINGHICSVTLNDGNSNKAIKVDNLSDRFQIFLPRVNATVENSTVALAESSKAVTSFNITDTNMTVFLTMEPNVNVSLRLVLHYDSPPNSIYNGTQVVLNFQEGYRWRITPSMMKRDPGTWYVDARLFNSTWVPDLQLSITTFMTKCMYWDTQSEIWTTYGCEVGPKSTPESTQCLCNHLTLFGSSFFVMPNHVDISRTAELFATVSKNYVVLALLCAFFGFYLMTLMWACYADRKALSKRKITLLEDNHPGAQYNYLVCVHTGHRKGAGTTANVMANLIGSDGESGTHNFTDPEKPVFERGSVDVFLLATPYPLGELKNLRLQHDNSGGQPSWYINRVVIQDFQTKTVFQFFCDCWLSTDKGEGTIKKTFNIAKNNEIASFRNIFTNRTSNGFRDEHIWVSVWDPPSRSPFTRAQRISCCMSLLLCTMAINIAFWNLPVDENSPIVLSIGFLELTWQEIMVGIQSGLLMFPINILIITIFRSIKPRIVTKKDIDVEIMKPPVVSIPSILKETEEVITMVSQSPRNKICLSNHLESSADLCPALENVHEFVQLMQGETVSDSHWVYCSKFLLCGLSHLLQCLEKLDARSFPTTAEYQHLLSTTNLLIRKAEMVFTSHLTYCPAPVKVVKKKHTANCWLPWWCVFIGWFLLLSISGISTFFTLLYGFEYGKNKSVKWVMSLGLSLFQSIFILQPLKVIGLAVFFALLLKPVAMEETEEVEQVLLSQKDKCRRYTGRDD
ncbi:polycystin-1-like protein 2 [Eucyclogobius newberryi]|uniref:polycystin-1-like protein 2 n=1 Tax=Eucyclogobius newberryi TaxID=166745 RepID=UPI003B5BDC1C